MRDFLHFLDGFGQPRPTELRDQAVTLELNSRPAQQGQYAAQHRSSHAEPRALLRRVFKPRAGRRDEDEVAIGECERELPAIVGPHMRPGHPGAVASTSLKSAAYTTGVPHACHQIVEALALYSMHEPQSRVAPGGQIRPRKWHEQRHAGATSEQIVCEHQAARGLVTREYHSTLAEDC